ncbi:MAG: TRAP transporter small permease [Hyphomicrobiaceae bacterium]|nr:TRAP transporter small permease [Hyphomicrobiaceae bacterium]
MFLRLWNTLEETIIDTLLVTMTLLVFAEVFMRFVLNTGFLWMEELTLHLSAWMVLFGASYGVRVGAHIGVDAFINHLSDKIRRRLGPLAVMLSIIYCGLIGYGGWVYLAKIRQYSIEMEDIPLNKWIAHSILVIGMALLAARLLELLIKIMRGQSLGFESVDEARKALETLHNPQAPENGEPGS